MRTPRTRSPSARRPRSLAAQLFAMQVVVVALVVAGCAVFVYVTDRMQAEKSAAHLARATAASVADSPSVRAAIRSPRPTAKLQPYAERVRRDTGVTFITIMDPRGRRWTHPDPERIGGRFLGRTSPALEGRAFTETFTGTLGPSVRAVVPVRDGGRVVGLVSAGIAVDTITEELRTQVLLLAGVAVAALGLGGLGVYMVNARLRRHTHDMNAAELSRLHDYHQATLHAVREGLLMLDGARRVALINDGARELLGLTGPGRPADPSAPEVVGRAVEELELPPSVTAALLSSGPRVDEVHLTADRVLVINTSPVSGGEQRGTVVTLRDHTELQSLAGELDSLRGFSEALRSQAHEAANRLHTVVSLIELGRTDEAVDFATEELELAQALTDRVVTAVAEPVLAALLLGKAAQAHERGVELALSEDSQLGDGPLPAGPPSRDLVTVLGNLIDNAVDAASGSPAHHPAPPDSRTAPASSAAAPIPGQTPARPARTPRVTVTLHRETAPPGPESPDSAEGAPDGTGGTLLIRVADTGPGIPPEATESVFERGWSTKPERPPRTAGASPSPGTRLTGGGHHAGGGTGRGLGLALVRQAVRRHGGDITVAEAPDGGAQFTVRLPLRTGPRPDPRPGGAVAPTAPGAAR
ncbi:sensor histidine kinase [Streptomyces sp. AJS327]|uniref:sensor histidine kinase n=1 Tax=Streptomyces sp. AJS327 TaxID=2545265 RepID=UPI0015DE4989|nr:sensor histidine kinase [Streptomyces sp. AJS327]MBA0051648.1 sensor histidine kinase [Streptomyces sp. AJS327]